MPGLNSGKEPFHVTLTTADGVTVGLTSVAADGTPHEFAGSLTPVDATEQFRPGGIPREWSDYSAGAGYTFFDDRVPNGYNWSKNVWTLVPHVALPSGELTELTISGTYDGEIRCGIEVSGYVYLSSGEYCLKLAAGSTTVSVITQFTTQAGVNADMKVTSVCLYLGTLYWGGSYGGTAQPMIQHVLATDAFTTAGATCPRWHVASFNGVDAQGTWSQWLIGTVASGAAFKYTNSSSPMQNTNWTPASADGTGVGDSAYPVNRIVTSRQAPFFLKPEGVHIVQRFGVSIPNITPHWADTYHTSNGIAGAIIAGKLYANILSGLDMVVGLDGQLNDTPYLVHPGADLPNESPVAGDVTAICRDGDWIVVAQYNSANTTAYLSWGKPRGAVPGQPGITNFVWHSSPCVIAGERVSWMRKIAPAGVPYLLIATRNAADTASKLYRLSLPKNGNVLQELATGGPWRCRTDTCTLYLPSAPGGLGVHAEKAVRQVATVSKSASDLSYLTVYVNPDEAGREQLGASVTESPYTETRITDDISGRQLAASVDFKAGSSTTPPILRAVTLWAAEGIKAATTYKGRFRFGRGTVLRSGAVDDTTDPLATWELLIASQGPRPCSMIDWKGVTYTVAFEQGATWYEREVRNPDRMEIEAELTFTVLARSVSYNDGSVYDSEATFAS